MNLRQFAICNLRCAICNKETPNPSMQPHNGLSRRASLAPGEPIATVLMAKTLSQPDLVSLAAGFVDSETLPIEATRLAAEAVLSDPQKARCQFAVWFHHRISSAARGNARAHAPGRRPHRPRIERLRRTSRDHARQQSVAVPLGRRAHGSRRHRDLRRTQLFRVLGHAGQSRRSGGGRRNRRPGHCSRGRRGGTATAQSRRRTGAASKQSTSPLIPTIPAALPCPSSRRAALVELAKRWSRESKIYIIEDVAYRELRYYGDDMPSLRSFDPEGDTVVQAGTFSKSYSPGIRVGWGILPPALLEPVLAEKGNVDFGSPNFNQLLMSAVLELKLFDEHVRLVRDKYREKLDAILQAADEFLAPLNGLHWVRPTGGLYVWLRLPEEIDAGLNGPLFDKAVERRRALRARRVLLSGRRRGSP